MLVPGPATWRTGHCCCGNTASPSCAWCQEVPALTLVAQVLRAAPPQSLSPRRAQWGQLWWPRVLGKFPCQHRKAHRPHPCHRPTSWCVTHPAFPELTASSCWPQLTWLMQSTGLWKVLLSRRSVAPRDCRCLARVAEAWPSNSQRKGPATESTTTRRAMPRDSRMGTLVLTHSSKVSCGSEGQHHGLCW